MAATVDSFSPAPPAPLPKPKKRRPATPRPAASGAHAKAREDGINDSEDDKPPARQKDPAAVPRRRVSAQEDDAESGDDDDEDKPRAKRAASRRPAPKQDEEEDAEEDDPGEVPVGSRPVVRPRLISFGLGGSLMGRSFSFNTPLQKENTFPRAGFVTGVEAYPLITGANGWLRMLGIGADLAMEFGSAALQQAGGGPTVSFPVSQRRYAFDVRYAITYGDRVVFVPALGIGNTMFDLKTNMPIPPSSCNDTMATQPCIPDVRATYLLADAHLRIAATDDFSLSLSAGYVLGLAVGRGAGEVGSEKTPAMSGIRFELGANWMLNDWLALRFAIPFIRHSFTFSGGTATYVSARETYLGGTVGALIFIP